MIRAKLTSLPYFKIATFVILNLAFIGCAGRAPKLDSNVKLGPIKEYDDKIDVKPLVDSPPPTGSAPVHPKNQGATPPKLGLEPVAKTEVKGKHKKKSKLDAVHPTDNAEENGSAVTAPAPEASESATTHLPLTEDPEGFVGRRPVADPFKVGEKVTLMMTYFGVSAGDATLELKPFVEVNGRKAYAFYSKLTSSAVFSMFYKVDDFCQSYVDYEQLVPLNFTLSATETKQIREVRQFFDWKLKKADYWERRVTKENGVEEKKRNWDLVPFSQNIYTAVQYIRTFALRDGKTYIYHVSDDGNTWDVKATVVRREILKTDLGDFKTIVIRPEVYTEGILKPMGEVLFWYTDDDRKFPVKFEAKIKIGKVIGYLRGLDKGAP